MANKKKAIEILNIIYEYSKDVLKPNPEDITLIINLVESYYRKKYISRSDDKIMAASFLWVYSKMNYLWEGDKKWSLQGIAELFDLIPKTVGNKTSEIIKSMKIKDWDERFCRESIAKSNPLNDYFMSSSGFIMPKNQKEKEFMLSFPFGNKKEDYYYDGCDFIGEEEYKNALKSFEKALEIDEEYVDAIAGIGDVYFINENLKEAEKYYQKAFELTKKHFKYKWPQELPWGITENRQYLRAIFSMGLLFWKKNNFEEAKRIFSLILNINNDDNQGARYVISALLKGISYEEFGKLEEEAGETGNYNKIEALYKEQNKIHSFYKWEGKN